MFILFINNIKIVKMDDKVIAREMQDKLQQLNQRIKELQQNITIKKEESIKYSNQINEINDQIK